MVSVLLVVLIASGFVTSGDTQRDPYGRQWDAVIKASEKVKYPRDSLWKSIQRRLPMVEPFPCEENNGKLRWRSATRPDSVHQLLPGDIDVIGAMGDSLTAGSGAREFNPIGVTVQDRGVSFSGGGQGSWREFITLPNILKVFNPNLRGYAIGIGDVESSEAQLNVAVPAALDDDALKQAKTFVSAMLRDRSINFTSDWKMLSILIGHNDLCSCRCYDERKHSPEAHKQNLEKALDYLYQKVPRLFVNMLSIIAS
ncbi:hypothetical protein J437_LFUL016034 [Ladona fulva]|uniref:Phospholipase B1, membrane-associated n=1 Tax=Ladona fulva TaxID=123851 RepID=A0A8K0KKR1_LADFU|nr:hypothetical protein J437_LFUL016034 [Ladona fulva]